jgi:GNAT superfamily N-acetyltransferase
MEESLDLPGCLRAALLASTEQELAATPAEFTAAVLARMGLAGDAAVGDFADPAGLVRTIAYYQAQKKRPVVPLQESMLHESMLLKGWDEYRELVTSAYAAAPSFEASAAIHWQALNQSNHLLFGRLLSKVKIIFVSGESAQGSELLKVQGKSYPVEYYPGGQPYDTQPQMRAAYMKTGVLRISIDYSEHPIFTVTDNIIFRTVHDFIVHILGNHPFGAKGEIASYNLHSKLAPQQALPALFTEVVGQACVAVSNGGFPEQKIAVLKGFDYRQIGKVDGYEIANKQLTKDGVPLQATSQSHDNGSETATVASTGAATQLIPTMINERDDLGKIATIRELVAGYPAHVVAGARALVLRYADPAAPSVSPAGLLAEWKELTNYQGVNIRLSRANTEGDQGAYHLASKTVKIYDTPIGKLIYELRTRLITLARAHANPANLPGARQAATRVCEALAGANWQAFRNTLYHELVHQQDDANGRLSRSFQDLSKKAERAPDQASRSYMNAPHETNARFVARAAEIMDQAGQPGYELPPTFAGFFSDFTGDEEFYFGQLTTANKRAAIKRVYDLYLQLQKQVATPPPVQQTLAEGPVSNYRDNKYFPGADIKYPDVIFAGITDARQARIGLEFYQKQVAQFNSIFKRKIQLSATQSGSPGPEMNFRVVTRNENGLEPEYFAYPTGQMGGHTVQRYIDKYVPGTSLRHELLHEAILPFITEKFELTNHADQSAASGSIDDVQRARAYNYSLEDVFYERVVEHLERLPDFADTFPMADFGKDWLARLAHEHGEQPLTIPALLETQRRFLAEDQTKNSFLLRVLPTLLAKVNLTGIKSVTELAPQLGRAFEQWFNGQKNIFSKELQAKLADFGARFMEIYQEALTKIAPRESAQSTLKLNESTGSVPRELFHGSATTAEVFTRFLDNQFFTASEYVAESYAQNMGGLLYTVSVNITHPLEIYEDNANLSRAASGMLLAGTDAKLAALFTQLYGPDVAARYKSTGMAKGLGMMLEGDFLPLIAYAKAKGHDALAFLDSSFDLQIMGETFIIFDGGKVHITAVTDPEADESDAPASQIKLRESLDDHDEKISIPGSMGRASEIIDQTEQPSIADEQEPRSLQEAAFRGAATANRLTTIAQGYDQFYEPWEPGYCRAEDADWVLDRAYPVSKLVKFTPDFVAQMERESAQGDRATGQRWDIPAGWWKTPQKDSDAPIILEKGGVGWVWDGHHRIAKAIAAGETTVPALVGRPRTASVSEKGSTLDEYAAGVSGMQTSQIKLRESYDYDEEEESGSKTEQLEAENAHGYALGELDEDGVAELKIVRVNPSAQGQGFGRQLTEEFIAKAWDAGAYKVTLQVESVHEGLSTEELYKFYGRLGFTRMRYGNWMELRHP